ncbi:hypothetical protein B4168_3561 [Anoxybacillus flavithermus]|nr:hypothetical protein B4168_3561 [Anoxybacillus flavithermus]
MRYHHSRVHCLYLTYEELKLEKRTYERISLFVFVSYL